MKIGVLNLLQKFQYITPVLNIHKKEGTVRFTTDYHRINQKLVVKMYPLPRIGETIQKMEGLQCVTALDTNLVYYTIKLLPEIQDMTTMVTNFW